MKDKFKIFPFRERRLIIKKNLFVKITNARVNLGVWIDRVLVNEHLGFSTKVSQVQE